MLASQATGHPHEWAWRRERPGYHQRDPDEPLHRAIGKKSLRRRERTNEEEVAHVRWRCKMGGDDLVVNASGVLYGDQWSIELQDDHWSVPLVSTTADDCLVVQLPPPGQNARRALRVRCSLAGGEWSVWMPISDGGAVEVPAPRSKDSVIAALQDDAAWRDGEISDLHDEIERRPPIPADVVAAFEEFDTNRSGKLDHAELRAALKSMGFETSQQQVRSSQTLRSYLLLPTYHGHSCCGHTFHDSPVMAHGCRGPHLLWPCLQVEQTLRRHDASGNGLLELGEFSDVVATLRLKKLEELTVAHEELRKAKDAQDAELKKTKSKLDAATALMAQVPPVSGFIPADVREAFEQFEQREKETLPSGGKTDWLRGGKVEEGGAATLARGTLAYTDVRSALKEAGVELKEPEGVKEAALAKYDADRAGKLELGEFWTLVHVLRRAQYQGVAAELKKLQASAKKAEEELGELRDEEGSRRGRRRGPSVPAEIQAAFDRYDANKSGKLDYSELQKALQAAGLEISEHQAAAMLQRYGRGRAGLMDVEEFAELVLSLRRQLLDSYAAEATALREQLRLALGGNHPESSKAVGVPADVRAAFERFDANKSGKLDYTELQEALRVMGFDPSVSYAEEQLRKYDRDGTGLLELDEFATLCRELPRHMLDGYGRDFAALNGQIGGKDVEIGRLRGELNELRERLDAKSLDGGPPPPRGAAPRYGDIYDDRGVRGGASTVYGDDVHGYDGGAEHVRVSLSARDLRRGEVERQRGGAATARGKPSSKAAGKPARPADKDSKATRREQALQQVLGGDGYDGVGDGDDGVGDGIGDGGGSRGERGAFYCVLHGLDAGGFIGWARLGASRAAPRSDGRSPRWDAIDVPAHKFDGARKLRIDVYSGHGGGHGGGGGGGSGAVMDLAEFSSLVRKLRRSGAASGLGHSPRGGSKAGPSSASGGGRKWSDAEIQGAFQSFDANKSGKLDHKELRPALKKMGVPADTNEAVRLLHAYSSPKPQPKASTLTLTLTLTLTPALSPNPDPSPSPQP